MSTITARRVRRYVSGTGKINGAKFPRDHFAMVSIRRDDCLGATFGKRALHGRILTPVGGAFIFSHPTKRRTKGRMCWFVVAA